MAALGRIFQLAGWLWFAAAIFAGALGLPEFSIFPAIILIFIARALRVQAKRRKGDEVDDHSRPPELRAEEPVQETRPLNTERGQAPPPSPPPPSSRVERRPEPDPLEEVKEHNEMLEKILATGSEPSERSTTQTTSRSGDDRKPSMTSAEMVAEARKRWDRRDY